MPNLFDSDTNKQGLIVYGGESSSGYGMVVAEAPAFERPKRKQTIYNVPGRNGSIIFQQDAWEDVNRSYKVWLTPSSNKTLVERVDALEAWLNSKTGYVRLEDNFEPDVYRLAYYSGGDGFSNSLTQYGEATLNFTCRPERFLKSGETAKNINLTSGSLALTNPTKYASKPLFAFTFNISSTPYPKFNINIGSKTLTVDINNASGASASTYTIDCETMSAHYSAWSQNVNSTLSGTFPVIPSGNSSVTLTMLTGSLSDITSAAITPRYFII